MQIRSQNSKEFDTYPDDLASAAGLVLLHAPNPMYDNGGAQRAAQLARAFLRQGWAVVFVSAGTVTESVDLQLDVAHPRLRTWSNQSKQWRLPALPDTLPAHCLVVTQVASRRWLRPLRILRSAGFVHVYDVIDNWHSSLGAPWFRLANETSVVHLATHLTATAPQLQQQMQQQYARPVTLLPNAYDDQWFKPDTRPDTSLATDKPIAIYAGSLWGSWFDWRLVQQLAERYHDISFVFVGDYRGQGQPLPENCLFIGLRPQNEIPALLAAAHAAVMPWKSDAITQATSPLQAYEYLAMGLPVLAPDLQPLRNIPGIILAHDRDHFLEIAGDVLCQRNPQHNLAKIQAFLQQNTWTNRVQELTNLCFAP